MSGAEREQRNSLLISLGLCLLMAMLRALIARLSPLIPGAETPAVMAAAIAVTELVWLALALPMKPFSPIGAADRANKPGGVYIALALPLGACLQIGCSALAQLLGWSGTAVRPLAADTPAEWALMVAVLAILPAFCEEAFFRGGLLRRLSGRMPLPLANAFCAVIFALMHGHPEALPALTAAGLLSGLITLRTGHWWAGALTHLGFNLMGFLNAYLPGSPLWALALMAPIAAAIAARVRLPRSTRSHWPAPVEWLLLTLLLAAQVALAL